MVEVSQARREWSLLLLVVSLTDTINLVSLMYARMIDLRQRLTQISSNRFAFITFKAVLSYFVVLNKNALQIIINRLLIKCPLSRLNILSSVPVPPPLLANQSPCTTPVSLPTVKCSTAPSPAEPPSSARLVSVRSSRDGTRVSPR